MDTGLKNSYTNTVRNKFLEMEIKFLSCICIGILEGKVPYFMEMHGKCMGNAWEMHQGLGLKHRVVYAFNGIP